MKRKTPNKKVNSKVTRVWLVVMLVFLGELLFYTWCRVQVTRVGYEISEGTTHRQGLLTLQQSLKIELARLRSPDRIETIARDQLGLTIPTPEQVIIIP